MSMIYVHDLRAFQVLVLAGRSSLNILSILGCNFDRNFFLKRLRISSFELLGRVTQLLNKTLSWSIWNKLFNFLLSVQCDITLNKSNELCCTVLEDRQQTTSYNSIGVTLWCPTKCNVNVCTFLHVNLFIF